MAVEKVDITARQPYAGGKTFGGMGPYERIDGVVTFAVDPSNEANQAIVDLGLAPRNGAGRVQFRADFTLIAPADPQRGNRRLVVDVVNRGRSRVVGTFNRAPMPVGGSRDVPEGDGFLFRRGYSVASIGWQWDVPRSDALLGLEAPQATANGKPIQGQTVVELRPNEMERTRLLADRVHKPYLAADVNEKGARLLVRDWEDGPDTEIPRGQWRFAKEEGGKTTPSAGHVYLEPGFQPGKIYYLVYTTGTAPVVGTGLLALRDIAAFLRRPSKANPVRGGFERVYAYGVSQTGRALRHFVYLGLNADEEGRPVYDGLIAHVAGGRRGQFNHRFAQPSNQPMAGFGHEFPFSDMPLQDPYSGRTAGLLDRQQRRGGVPKIMYTNTSAEYWRGDGSLVHTDPRGERDLPPWPHSRAYLFAGTQHAGGTLPQTRVNANEGSRGRYPFNVVDYAPLLRAALVNLDRWVSEGVEPPPSKHPRLDDGTALTRKEVLDRFTMVPGLHRPDPERLWVLRELDLGSEAAKGVGRYPAKEGRAYPSFVSSVDGDGNETSGIRLPDLSVPVGTHTGWNPRDPETGAPEQIISMQGFTLFFPATRAARKAASDPRRSIEERYESREAYLKQVRDAARKLASERYILDEDVETVTRLCGERYDAATAAAPPSHGT